MHVYIHTQIVRLYKVKVKVKSRKMLAKDIVHTAVCGAVLGVLLGAIAPSGVPGIHFKPCVAMGRYRDTWSLLQGPCGPFYGPSQSLAALLWALVRHLVRWKILGLVLLFPATASVPALG